MKKVVVLFAFLLVLVLALSFAPTSEAAPPGPTIVDVAAAANAPGGAYEGQFDILIAALGAADPAVLATLGGNGQYTVFAPTDDAFAAAFAELGVAPGDVLANQEFLTDVLLYHVAHGRRYAGSVVASERIRTLNKAFLFQDGGTLTDQLGREANIIVTDVEAANGIIHAIDAVVLPYAP